MDISDFSLPRDICASLASLEHSSLTSLGHDLASGLQNLTSKQVIAYPDTHKPFALNSSRALKSLVVDLL